MMPTFEHVIDWNRSCRGALVLFEAVLAV